MKLPHLFISLLRLLIERKPFIHLDVTKDHQNMTHIPHVSIYLFEFKSLPISMSTPIQPNKKYRKQVDYKAMQTASSKEITINNETFPMCKVN